MTVSLECLQQEFQEAVSDLWWMSETDAPFEVLVWPQAFEKGFSLDEFWILTELDSDLPFSEVSLEQFFASATQEQDWHSDLEKEDVKRFQLLEALIAANLSEVKVCRIGETHLDILIIGKTENNDWIALSTQAVET